MSKSDNVASKASVSGFTISLGLVNMIGDLHLARVPNAGNEEKFVMVCPTCDEPHKVSQEYVCSESADHGPFSQGDCSKAKDLGDGALVKVSQAQIDAAKKSKLQKKHLELSIHPLEEIENNLVPEGSTQIFLPHGDSTSTYALLLEEVRAHPELAFIGTINLRNKDRTVRLQVGIDGNLVVQELEWFQDVKHIDPPEYVDPSEKARQMADSVIENYTEPFDPENYTKESRERLSELIDQARAGDLPEVPSVEIDYVDESEDLEARLEMMLASKGTAKKKAPARKAS